MGEKLPLLAITSPLVYLTNRKTPFYQKMFVSIRIIKQRIAVATSSPHRSSHVDDELNAFELLDTIPTLPSFPRL